MRSMICTILLGVLLAAAAAGPAMADGDDESLEAENRRLKAELAEARHEIASLKLQVDLLKAALAIREPAEDDNPVDEADAGDEADADDDGGHLGIATPDPAPDPDLSRQLRLDELSRLVRGYLSTPGNETPKNRATRRRKLVEGIRRRPLLVDVTVDAVQPAGNQSQRTVEGHYASDATVELKQPKGTFPRDRFTVRFEVPKTDADGLRPGQQVMVAGFVAEIAGGRFRDSRKKVCEATLRLREVTLIQ